MNHRNDKDQTPGEQQRGLGGARAFVHADCGVEELKGMGERDNERCGEDGGGQATRGEGSGLAAPTSVGLSPKARSCSEPKLVGRRASSLPDMAQQ